MLFIGYYIIWLFGFFFFKQKTAYEMRISDWSSDVCSSDLLLTGYVPQTGSRRMLITALLLAAMAPSPAATVATTRAAYTKCLRTDLKTALEAKKAATDYEAALTTVCVTEQSAFRAAVIAFAQSSGNSPPAAAEPPNTH